MNKNSADALEDDFDVVQVDKKDRKRKNISVTNSQSAKKQLKEPLDLASLNGNDQHYEWHEFMKRRVKDLTEIEIEQKLIPKENFTHVALPHCSKDLSLLESFVTSAYADWLKMLRFDKTDVGKGEPRVVILTSSAVRSVEIIRALPSINQLCKIGKLFAKHFKVEDQVEHLKQSVVKVVVGTPSRMKKLVELGALSFSHVDLIIVDVFRDLKERTIFDIPEVATELFSLLNEACRNEIIKNDTKITFY